MRRFDYPAPPPSEITPEPVYRARRQLLGLGLASPLLALTGCADADDGAAAVTAASAPAASDSRDGFRAGDELT
ncbi:MAG: mononuclear molybdenum enzyme YedY, partial [Arenimonas sp.]|nr:mononuclear molybdenum enzyme YedY [Arenimonas sp.]